MYTYSTMLGERANNCIDLRRNLGLLDDEFSIDVLYIRNCKYIRCDCFNDLEKSGRPGCPKCFGSGYFASIQKFRAIESSVSAYSSSNQSVPMPVGLVDQKSEVYYLDYKAAPRIRDFILKVTWKNKIPIDVIQVLEISNIYEMRGDGGRLEVAGCHILDRPDCVKRFNTVLKKFPRGVLQAIGNGRRYVWPKSLLT